jgi:glycosyltransferase involved in cell wall biosynthesis
VNSLDVLFIQLSSELGEDEQLSIEDIFELNSLGVNWRAICLQGSPVSQQLIQAGASKVITLQSPPRSVLDFNMRHIIRDQLSKGSNLIHAFGGNQLGSILPWVLGTANVPVLVSEGPEVRKRFIHSIQSLFYHRLDSLLVPTHSLKRRIEIMRPELAKKIEVLVPGLDLNIFNPEHFDFKLLRQRWGIESDVHLVGMVGSPEYPKAQTAFVKAAASFLRNEELARQTKFVIVGYAEESGEELKSLIQQFHLQDHIILVPLEESIPKILGTLDVYVIPSSKATFGLQAVESLAMGTPIICASGPDSSEWIGDSQAGLLMRSGDSFDLQRNLKTMLEDPTKLKEMGLLAVRYARDHYDRNKRTARLLDIYNRARQLRSR